MSFKHAHIPKREFAIDEQIFGMKFRIFFLQYMSKRTEVWYQTLGTL